MTQTRIEYCDQAVNFFHGCHHGCTYCYARRFAERFGNNPKAPSYYHLKQFGKNPFTPTFCPGQIDIYRDKLNKAKPGKLVFIGTMGDLGGGWDWLQREGRGYRVVSSDTVKSATVEFISSLPQHTFLLLTKEPRGLYGISWPDNVRIGTSASYTDDAEMRLMELSEVDCSKHWLSIEPLLEVGFSPSVLSKYPVDWVAIGAQTGAGAAPCHEYGWTVDNIVVNCKISRIRCFVKDNLRRHFGRPQLQRWPQERIDD